MIAPDRGRETLALIEHNLGRYNRWMYDQLAPWVCGRILEVGSGIGNMSAFMIDAPRLALTDVEPESLADLQAKFGDRPTVTVDTWDLGEEPPARLLDEVFDTVICLNVLEHIEDDHAALLRMRARLAPGGHLVLLVPAHQMLFNGFDRGVRHFRRYNKGGLAHSLTRAGLVPTESWYFNMLGALGWYVNGNMLGKSVLPAGQLALIDRLVPLLRCESLLPRPFGISVIAIAKAGDDL